MESAATVLAVGQAYLWIGAAVSAVFLLWGLDRVDAKAAGSWVFRPLLVPGVLLIWPMVLWRWYRLERGGDDPQARHRPPLGLQRVLGYALALTLPALIVAAVLIRQDGPVERAAVPLERAGAVSGE